MLPILAQEHGIFSIKQVKSLSLILTLALNSLKDGGMALHVG